MYWESTVHPGILPDRSAEQAAVPAVSATAKDPQLQRPAGADSSEKVPAVRSGGVRDGGDERHRHRHHLSSAAGGTPT